MYHPTRCANSKHKEAKRAGGRVPSSCRLTYATLQSNMWTFPKTYPRPCILCHVPSHLSSGCMTAWLRACSVSQVTEKWPLCSCLSNYGEKMGGSPCSANEWPLCICWAGCDLNTLRVASPFTPEMCFALSMNGFGKMSSYFFLDIAWWYYQYQRGKKASTNLAWSHYLQRKCFWIKCIFCNWSSHQLSVLLC